MDTKNIQFRAGEILADLLPAELWRKMGARQISDGLSEVHLRTGRPASLVVAGENVTLDFYASQTILEDILTRACRGSVYAYRDTIREGYVPLEGGVRLGLAGRAVTEGGTVVAVTELTALCFRIPHHIAGVAREAYDIWCRAGGNAGMLVVSSPGGGKTTFLRDFLLSASHTRRVAVVDSREELVPAGMGEMVDVLRGYPRAEGLEIALRTLSPEILVCDEIGTSECNAVGEIVHSGIPLIASMHGTSLKDIRRRRHADRLLDGGAFTYLVSLEFIDGVHRATVTEIPC